MTKRQSDVGHLQGMKKVLSDCPGQVDFPARQVTLQAYLSNVHGPTDKSSAQLNKISALGLA